MNTIVALKQDLVGQQLGNYRLLKVLGQGGFATVYLAKHRYLGTYAAVKVLRTRLTGDEIDQFCIEARIAARLIHPHIVRVLEFGLEERTPFLVMDYAPDNILRYHHPSGVPIGNILQYVKQIASSLEHIHNYGLIHQDVKPENILIGSDGQILLSDFGIAVASNQISTLGAKEIAGTVSYMAPEQIHGKPCPASDQYALGVVVYRWLCGELPFHGSSSEIITQHLSALPPSMRMKVPTIPSAVEKVVMKALAKDPRQRFQSVQEFALALERAYKQHIAVQSLLDHSKPTRYPPPARANAVPSSRPPRTRQQEPQSSRKEIRTMFAAGMLICTLVGIILCLLGIDVRTIGFLIWLCLVSMPLLRAQAMKNRPAFMITTGIFLISSLLGVGFHSQLLFAVVYVSLMLLSISTMLSLGLCNF